VISPVHNKFEARGFRASIPRDGHVGPVLVPVTRKSSASAKASRLSELDTEGVRCARGSLLAIGTEAAIALSFYGIWRMLHFFW